MRSLIDVTRAHNEVIEVAIRSFIKAHDLQSDDQIECLMTSSQVTPCIDQLEITFISLELESVDDAGVGGYIYDRVQQLAKDGEELIVASYRSSLRQGIAALKVIYPFIEFEQLSRYVHPNQDLHVEMWDESFMPRYDAIRALVAVLFKAKIPLRMTDIRKPLTSHDERFRKRVGSFNSRPRFMSMLVALATDKNYVIVLSNVGNEQNPLVQLTPSGRTFAGAFARESSSEGGSNAHETVGDINNDSSERSRSDLYITTLRRGHFGPFQEVRLAVFEEIELLVKDGSRTSSELIRDAISNVRETRASELIRTNKPFPWSTVRSFISALASRAPVFLVEGAPTPHTWIAAAQRVTGLIKDWQLALDGELICYLLDQGVSISLDDIPALAGALYNSRRDEFSTEFSPWSDISFQRDAL